jgi:hypothetical protein
MNSNEAVTWGILYAYQNLIGAGLIALAIGVTIGNASRLIARALRGEREAPSVADIVRGRR